MVKDENKTVVDELEPSKEKFDCPPHQTANALFHFESQMKYLLPHIEAEAIIPRYCEEDISYLNIGSKSIAYPMSCFCDIPLHRIADHVSFYGKFGIAFSKDWGLKNGLQPIQYINPESFLCKDFSSVFHSALHNEENTRSADFLLSQMVFYKPVEGRIKRLKNGEEKEIPRNFTDEHEWRYVAPVECIGLEPVIMETELFARDVHNQTLATTEAVWLKFELNQVKYIILESDLFLGQLVECLEKKRDAGLIDKKCIDRLLTKVIFWNEMEGDF